MTTVLAVYNSEGCVGRCDARCHEATSPDCDCICGGRYHGVGAGNAVHAATEHIDPDGELRRAFAEARGCDPDDLRIEVGQEPLFAGPGCGERAAPSTNGTSDRQVDVLERAIVAAEAVYDRALRHPRCEGLDEAGARLRGLYATQRTREKPHVHQG